MPIREHGTNRGYGQHVRANPREVPCEPCYEAHRVYNAARRPGERQALAPCGTQAAYTRHLYRGEPTDAACRAAHAVYMRPYASGRSRPPLQPCPSHAAYTRHVRRKEEIDPGCREAHTRYVEDRKRIKRERARKERGAGEVRAGNRGSLRAITGHGEGGRPGDHPGADAAA